MTLINFIKGKKKYSYDTVTKSNIVGNQVVVDNILKQLENSHIDIQNRLKISL